MLQLKQWAGPRWTCGPVKGLRIDILGCEGHRILRDYALCCCSARAARVTRTPMTFLLVETDSGQVEAVGYNLPIPG